MQEPCDPDERPEQARGRGRPHSRRLWEPEAQGEYRIYNHPSFIHGFMSKTSLQPTSSPTPPVLPHFVCQSLFRSFTVDSFTFTLARLPLRMPTCWDSSRRWRTTPWCLLRYDYYYNYHLPRQYWASIGCTENVQPIWVTLHLDLLRIWFVLLTCRGLVVVNWKKNTLFFLNTLHKQNRFLRSIEHLKEYASGQSRILGADLL